MPTYQLGKFREDGFKVRSSINDRECLYPWKGDGVLKKDWRCYSATPSYKTNIGFQKKMLLSEYGFGTIHGND